MIMISGVKNMHLSSQEQAALRVLLVYYHQIIEALFDYPSKSVSLRLYVPSFFQLFFVAPTWLFVFYPW